MGNKYQKSLDVLKGLVLSTPVLTKDFKKDFEILQELIDNYEKLLREKLEWQQEKMEEYRNGVSRSK